MHDHGQDFDPYAEWLQLPPGQRPPDHYALLGVPKYEGDIAKIDRASKRRSAYLHQLASGPNRAAVQRLLGEVATARRVLMNESSKRDYDASLRAEAQPPTRKPTISSAAPQVQSATPDFRPGNSSINKLGHASKPPGRSRHAQRMILYGAVITLFIGLIFVLARRQSTSSATAQPADSSPSTRSRATIEEKRSAVFDSLAQSTQTSQSTQDATAAGKNKQANKPATTIPTSTAASQAKFVRLANDASWVETLPERANFSTASGLPFEPGEVDPKRLQVANQRLEFLPFQGKNQVVWQKLSDWQLLPGQAASIRTNFPLMFAADLRLGLGVGKESFVLQPGHSGGKQGLLLRVNGKQVALFGKLGSGPLTLTVYRPGSVDNEFLCFVSFREETHVGRVRLSGAVEEADLALIHFMGATDLVGSLWVDQIRLGQPARPPDMPNSEMIRVEAAAGSD